MTPTPNPDGDLRRQRGDRSRRLITRRAVDIASLDGLGGLSFGRLADDLTISKAGIQTLFRTKENLQLATVHTAQEVFVEAVLAPTQGARAGGDRLRLLIERWMDYATQPLFPGGCFWGATVPEFDSHPGPIREALREQRRAWLGTLAREFDAAAAEGQVEHTDTEATILQIDALLNAANIALRLANVEDARKMRQVIDRLLPPSPQ
ncbi:TetR/AcrR family transcriptional regulator [Nocardia sp. NPDC058633]|uniref:TetR/AcrR family transcriptional regulator n=1 Tax=Nocardia sp. NPDC058633 TaxID=3346568 RepID=UPI00364CD768